MLNFFLSTFVPALGVVLTAALLIYGVYYRWVDVPQKWLLTREALVALIVVAGLCDVWLGVRAYLSHTEKQTWQDSAAVGGGRWRRHLSVQSLSGFGGQRHGIGRAFCRGGNFCRLSQERIAAWQERLGRMDRGNHGHSFLRGRSLPRNAKCMPISRAGRIFAGTRSFSGARMNGRAAPARSPAGPGGRA